jgi:hypothetical protein
VTHFAKGSWILRDNTPVAAFFDREPEVLPIFNALSKAIIQRHPGTQVLVQKSQVSFRDPRPFCAAWLPIRRDIKRRPDHYLVVSFGLDREIVHPRLVDTVEPYPGRWTHHVILATPADIDRDLMDWIDLAHAWKHVNG